MNSATVSSIFFSLRGSLPRQDWHLAMVISSAVFTCGLSLLLDGQDDPYAQSAQEGPSWLLLFWCLAFLGGITLLCAKRLLDCQRPMWLALTIPPPGVLFILALAWGMHTSWPLLTFMAAYLTLFALPALIACALYEWDD